jgi:hypothetical protein
MEAPGDTQSRRADRPHWFSALWYGQQRYISTQLTRRMVTMVISSEIMY